MARARRLGCLHTSALVAFHETEPARASVWLAKLYVLRRTENLRPPYTASNITASLFYQSGFDLDFRQYSVGLVTMGPRSRARWRKGRRTTTSCTGTSSTVSWARDERELVRLDIYPRGARGALQTSNGTSGGIKKCSGGGTSLRCSVLDSSRDESGRIRNSGDIGMLRG